MIKIFALCLAFIISLAFLFVQPTSIQSADGQQPKYINDPQYGPVVPGAYNVILSESFFASIDDDPKFADKAKVTPSAIPQQNAKVDPALKHEYDVKVGTKVYDKVRQYNGTNKATHPDSPLGKQEAIAKNPMIHAVRGFTVENVKDPLIFIGDPDIQIVEPQQFGVKETQYLPRGVDRVDIDRAATAAYKADNRESQLNVDVAVIDEMVFNHADLNLVQSVNLVPGTMTSGVGTHGTHVAGTCCARDNLGGVVGTAPGARVHSVAVCGTGSTDGCGNFVAAFDWVTARASTIEIATMSIGTSCGWLCASTAGTSGTTLTAINNMVSAGVTFFVSAGNDRINANNKSFCDVASAICVSSLVDTDGKCGSLGPDIVYTRDGITYPNGDDSRSAFSNFGSAVDLMAPGSYILSTFPAGFFNTGSIEGPVDQAYPYIGLSTSGGYGILGGTSMATPHAAGVGALVKLSNPSFTPTQVKSTLQADAYPQTQSCDGFGKGGISGANSQSSEEILYGALR